LRIEGSGAGGACLRLTRTLKGRAQLSGRRKARLAGLNVEQLRAAADQRPLGGGAEFRQRAATLFEKFNVRAPDRAKAQPRPS